MLCMMPDPLSPQDEQYLSKFAEVVDYAHTCRGMQVWVGECCNNVAATDLVESIEHREYFGTEKLLNPADPRGVEELMSSRSNLYRWVPNADGYWIIDSDPGFWKGSPSPDFVDIFIRNQSLMRQYNTSDAQMIYSYGTIEPEPGVPLTLFRFSSLRERIEYAVANGLDGYMAQAQTPIVQFPNIYYVMRCLWNPEFRHQSPEYCLKELASQLYPEYANDATLAWLAMMNGDLTAMHHARKALEDALKKSDGRVGAVGRFLFGDVQIVMDNLLALLEIRESGEQFRQSVNLDRPLKEIRQHFYTYVKCTLHWYSRHDYNAMGGNKYLFGPYLEAGASGWHSYIKKFDRTVANFDIHWPTKSRLIQEGEFHPALVDNVILEVISQPDIEHA